MCVLKKLEHLVNYLLYADVTIIFLYAEWTEEPIYAKKKKTHVYQMYRSILKKCAQKGKM